MDIAHDRPRHHLRRIGYDQPEYGFDGHTCAVLTAIDEQSRDIAMGVDNCLLTMPSTPRRGRSGHDVRLRLHARRRS
ncbi:MAG: hypothetical protein ACLU3I_22755 [Acutalibacteraceae bacterium]